VPARPASLEDVYAVDAEARVRAGALLPAMV